MSALDLTNFPLDQTVLDGESLILYPSLTRYQVSYNHLTSLPHEIGNLTKLTVLNGE